MMPPSFVCSFETSFKGERTEERSLFSPTASGSRSLLPLKREICAIHERDEIDKASLVPQKALELRQVLLSSLETHETSVLL